MAPLLFCRCYPGKEELPNPKDSQRSLLCAAAWGVGSSVPYVTPRFRLRPLPSLFLSPGSLAWGLDLMFASLDCVNRYGGRQDLIPLFLCCL